MKRRSALSVGTNGRYREEDVIPSSSGPRGADETIYDNAESCIVLRYCRVMLSSGDPEGGPRPTLPRTRKSYGPVGWALAHLQSCIRVSGDSKSDVIPSGAEGGVEESVGKTGVQAAFVFAMWAVGRADRASSIGWVALKPHAPGPKPQMGGREFKKQNSKLPPGTETGCGRKRGRGDCDDIGR